MDDIKPVLWVDDDLDIHFGATHPEMTGKDWEPLYPESALLQAREEGRREGMLRIRDAICKQFGVDADYAESLYVRVYDDGEGEPLNQWIDEIAAITRASEGK